MTSMTLRTSSQSHVSSVTLVGLLGGQEWWVIGPSVAKQVMDGRPTSAASLYQVQTRTVRSGLGGSITQAARDQGESWRVTGYRPGVDFNLSRRAAFMKRAQRK